MNNRPQLSIVTITKNNHDGLIATYQSLCNQSGLEDCEWIIVDGKSTDKTTDAFPELQRIIPNTTIISEPDQGIYDAMNKGLKIANGAYILWLNAGDQMADDSIVSTLLETLKHQPDFIYGDAYTALSDDGFALKKARQPKTKFYGMFAYHQTMVFRKELIANTLYDPNYVVSGDYAFVLEFLKKANNIIYYDSPMIIFEHNGISERRGLKGRNENFKARHDILDMPLYQNIGIWLLNTISWTIRQTLPKLYKALRYS